MPQKKKIDADQPQLLMSFPAPKAQGPVITDMELKEWKRLKSCYPGYLLLYRHLDLFYALAKDATELHQITAFPVYTNTIKTCSFHRQELQRVLTLAVIARIRIAICDPPDQQDRHEFM